jgi:hypothetical protein
LLRAQGGTAINLFVRDMPRLSVDIDLTYLPITDRSAALRDIDRALTGNVLFEPAPQLHTEGFAVGAEFEIRR